MIRFSIKQLLALIVLVSVFFSGWFVGRLQHVSLEAMGASERGRYFFEKRELEDEIHTLKDRLKDCHATNH